MKKPQLVVMAAGLGSRYGGLKQMEPVTKENEIILDFSVYDAIKAGFEDVIFVIKPEMEEEFKFRVLKTMSKYVNARYVFQSIEQVPEGYQIPEGRTKPWGTCHAVMACSELIDSSFAVINADDFYGRSSFEKVFHFLTNDNSENTYCMAGYRIENTLSEQGTVTRGICKTDSNSYLTEIAETKNIGWEHGQILSKNGDKFENIPLHTVVSMNFWGFRQSMMEYMTQNFPQFLDSIAEHHSVNEEYLLPVEVGKLLETGKVKVKVLTAEDRWYGITYKEDKRLVSEAFEKMKEEGKYPERLWP